MSCRAAVISGGPRQVLPRRAAIPAVKLTSAPSTSAFVPARSATRFAPSRASHLIQSDLPIAVLLAASRSVSRSREKGRLPILGCVCVSSLFSLIACGTHVTPILFFLVARTRVRPPSSKCDAIFFSFPKSESANRLFAPPSR